MTRPPHAASSVVGYASDTASAVAKVEPNSNRSRETGRPYFGQTTSSVGPTIIPSNNGSRLRRDPLSLLSHDAARGPN